METKNAKKTNGAFDGTGKESELFNIASSTMIDSYKKQLDTVFGFYKNIFNSAIGAGRNNWGSDLNVNPFLTANNSFKSFFSPLSWLKTDGEYTGQLTSVYENFFREVSEFNKNWLGAFQNTYNLGHSASVELNEKYQQLLEERRNATKSAMDSLTETYNKQLDFSVESNKKMISELNKQMERVIKSNAEFWNGVVKTYGTTAKSEEEKSHKTSKKEEHEHA